MHATANSEPLSRGGRDHGDDQRQRQAERHERRCPEQLRVDHELLLVGPGIRDDGGERDLGPRAGGGGDCEQGQAGVLGFLYTVE